MSDRRLSTWRVACFLCEIRKCREEVVDDERTLRLGMSDDSLILAIETSNPTSSGHADSDAGVALVQHGPECGFQVLGVEHLRQTGHHDDDLMPAIDRLFTRCQVERRTLDRVAVSIGPGGYTGLRVAVTTANVIATACQAQAVGVPTALALIRRATIQMPCAVCLAVKGDSLWVHRFPENDARVLRATSLVDSGLAGVVGDQHLPDEVRSALQAEGVQIESPRFDPVAVAEASIHLKPSHSVRALYAREPEAVTRWRARPPVR